MPSITKLVLVGFPNTGKTTLFNQLMGTRYKIGNWSGVTIKEHRAEFEIGNKKYEIADVPGILSIYDADDQLDGEVCRQALESADVFLNVIDGRHIHRDLVLALQLLCYEKPMLTVVTHEDKMKLSKEDIKALMPMTCLFASEISLEDIIKCSKKLKAVDVEGILEWPVGFSMKSKGDTLAKRLKTCLVEDESSDIQIAEGFYHTAAILIDRHGCREADQKEDCWFDQWLLHPIWGTLAFFVVVYLMFALTIGLGGAFADLISGFMVLCLQLLPDNHVFYILIYSAGIGVATCLGFLPILGVMYIYISYLEQSGYLSRMVLLSDSIMKPIGLSGHSVIPLMLGFGCNIPAVMATRVISGRNNRILTALMVPFMSCSARLTIFAIFSAAFFPKHGAMIIMGLYLLSLTLGILTVLMLNYVFAFKSGAPLSVVLPAYQWPEFSDIIKSTAIKLRHFLKENFWLIVVFSMVIGTLGRTNGYLEVVNTSESILAQFGMYTVRWFSFMGLSEDNWQACVALYSGIAAKEVVIATLNSLYQSLIPAQSFSQELWGLLIEFGNRILYFPLQLFFVDFGEAGVHRLYQGHFSQSSALAYMVFVLLYFPCLSTMIVLKNEFDLWVSVFSFVWSSFLAIWFAKIAYWGISGIDGLCILLVFGIMKAVRSYYDATKA